jgi:hypothetical protein
VSGIADLTSWAHFRIQRLSPREQTIASASAIVRRHNFQWLGIVRCLTELGAAILYGLSHTSKATGWTDEGDDTIDGGRLPIGMDMQGFLKNSFETGADTFQFLDVLNGLDSQSATSPVGGTSPVSVELSEQVPGFDASTAAAAHSFAALDQSIGPDLQSAIGSMGLEQLYADHHELFLLLT